MTAEDFSVSNNRVLETNIKIDDVLEKQDKIMSRRFYGDDAAHTPKYEKSALEGNYTRILREVRLPPKPCILDLASGKGAQGEYLKKVFPDSVIVESDISPYASLSRNKKNSNFFVRLDLKDLPFASKSFDFINFKDAIVHVSDLNNFANEIKSILKPNGQILVTTYTNMNKGEPVEHFTEGGVDYFFRSVDEIEETLQRHGLALSHKGKYKPQRFFLDRFRYFPKHFKDWADNERSYFIFLNKARKEDGVE